MVDSLRDVFAVVEGIGSSKTTILDENQLTVLIRALGQDQSLVAVNDSCRIANNITTGLIAGRKLNLQTNDHKEWMLLLQNEDPDLNTTQWKDVRNLIGTYSGIETTNLGYCYLKLEANQNSSLNATLKSNNSIINAGIELPFRIPGMDSVLPESQKVIFIDAIHKLKSRLIAFDKALVSPEQSLYKSRMNEHLSSEERLFGFVQLWTELKYNFVFSERLNQLNWDQVLLDYLPQVKAEQSDLDYYELLQGLCAKLKDGHTEVYFPNKLPLYSPTVELKYLDGEAIVINVTNDLKTVLPPGSRILSVEGIDTKEYLETKIIPRISSSTKHILLEEGVRELLSSRSNNEVKFTYETPDHKINTLSLKRELPQNNNHWLKTKPRLALSEFKLLDAHIAYLSLNSFSNKAIVSEFEKQLEKLSVANAIIIDLRNNGGGNSEYAYEILKYFAAKPFITSTWSTRENRPAFKAWGASLQYKADSSLDDFERLSKKNYLGTSMYNGTPDTIVPDKKIHIQKPLVVLTGSNTASAAEDFLIALDQMHIATTIGSTTYGSTGQPLFIKLPGGGSARICTKKDSYADGREFVGYGIKPDIEVRETITSVLNDQDPVLEAAVQFLLKKN